ncbi:MAG: hypothetical protein JXQ67_09715 [Campylobacterales bacterium]|nr:hypothetical protein [Campylobacterales bacterium]
MKTKVLFTLPLFLFLSACTTAQLAFNQENITITDNSNKKQIITTNLIYEDYLKLSNMKIKYGVVKFDNGAIAVLEELSPNSEYMFDGSVSKTVLIGFNNYFYEKVNSVGNINFFVLKEKSNSTILYLTLYNRNKKDMKLIYTDNKNLFDTIQKKFNIDDKLIKSEEASNKIIIDTTKQNAKRFIQTNWSEKNLILDGLLKQRYTMPKIVH